MLNVAKGLKCPPLQKQTPAPISNSATFQFPPPTHHHHHSQVFQPPPLNLLPPFSTQLKSIHHRLLLRQCSSPNPSHHLRRPILAVARTTVGGNEVTFPSSFTPLIVIFISTSRLPRRPRCLRRGCRRCLLPSYEDLSHLHPKPLLLLPSLKHKPLDHHTFCHSGHVIAKKWNWLFG